MNDPKFLDPSYYNQLAVKADADEELKQLLSKTKELMHMERPGTDDYDRALLLRAFALRFQVSFHMDLQARVQILLKVENMTKPFAESPKGFYIHTQALIQQEMCYRNLKQFPKALQALKKAEQNYNRYKHKHGDKHYWTFKELASNEPPKSSRMPFVYLQIAHGLWEMYNILEDESNAFKYACRP